MRDRLTLVVNRAGTGVPTIDVEKAVGIPCYAEIRSAGPTMVKAANEGRTLVELGPKAPIAQDFSILADKLLGRPVAAPAKTGFKLFGRLVVARA